MAGSATTVALYSMNYAEGVLTRMPYMKFFGERSLALLSILRDEDARLVLINSPPVDQYLIDWHLRYLFGFSEDLMQSARRRLVTLSPAPDNGTPLDRLVAKDTTILDFLKDEARRGPVALANFAASADTDFIARETGAVVEEGPAESAELWGSKSGSKVIFELSDVPSPRGTPEVWSTVESLLGAVATLARRVPPPRLAVAKLNHQGWGDGFGLAVVDCRLATDLGDLRRAVVAGAQSWDRFVLEISRGGAIVEEYLPDRTCSPSGQGRIDASGEVRILSTHQQILNRNRYLGCEFPAPSELRARIHDSVARIGSTLASKGVSGTFGVDFIALADGSLLAVEVNLRKGGASHVVSYVEGVVGERVGPDGDLKVKGKPVHDIHRRVWEPDRLRGSRIPDAIERLRSSGLLFCHERGTGAMFHILGALPSEGYVETTCMEFSPQATEQLDRRVQSLLTEAR